MTVCLVVAATLASPGAASAQTGRGSAGGGAAPSVVVEAFENLSGAAADEWIGRGIAEAVAADLGGRVDTGDGAVGPRVRGSYQRIGDRVRITATLVDGVVGPMEDAVKIDGVVSDLFALQDELAARLAGLLGRQVSMGDAAPVPGGGEEGVAGRLERAEPRAESSPNVDAAPVESRPGTGGFAMTRSAIIDGPPPPAPPAVVARDSQGRMTMRAVRLGGPLQLDGLLDEGVYADVDPVTDFIQQEPDEGAPATDQTELWVLFDDDMLYIAARCWSEFPDRLVANEMKRDAAGMFGNETLGVVLDTFYDRRSAFNFITNPLGGLFDATITNERTPKRDWNTVWDVRTGRFDGGWTVEMAVPFKSLRYGAGPEQIWGFNVQRRAASKNEISFLTPIPAALSFAGLFKLSSAATLVGLEVPEAGTRLELKTYAIADATTNLASVPTFRNELAGDVGFDVKYGVTQGLTADFTYNTDFAQVEVDEQQVNLTRFSLFYPEKREFFLEGQGIFDFGGGFRPNPTAYFFSGQGFGGTAPVMFFSRQIGVSEDGAVPIQGGGRLTGRAGPYSIGLLDVQTGEDLEAGALGTNFAVARVKRDVLRRSTVGALVARRSVAIDGGGANSTYGVDGVFSFFDNLNVNTYLARTQTPDVSGDDISYQAQFDYSGDTWAS